MIMAAADVQIANETSQIEKHQSQNETHKS